MRTGTILIVDDSSTSRMIIHRCIQMAGIEPEAVLFAENGVDAIAVMRGAGRVSVVVTDLNMPKMDGQAFMGLLKSDPSTASIPVIVVSSVVKTEDGAEPPSCGGAVLVGKPVSPAKMLAAFEGLGS